MELFQQTFPTKMEDPRNRVDSDVVLIPSYLDFIQEGLLKLDQNSKCYGDSELLTHRITLYQKQFRNLKNQYEQFGLREFLFESPAQRAQYFIDLSLLADMIDSESRTYFYLESLEQFLGHEIGKDNFDQQKQVLLELEYKISNYYERNQVLAEILRKKLLTSLLHFLEVEIQLGKSRDFYMCLSRDSQNMIEQVYFEELVHRVDHDFYISRYVSETSIGSLSFNYEIFSYMIQKKNAVELGIEKSDRENGLINRKDDFSDGYRNSIGYSNGVSFLDNPKVHGL